MKTDTFPCDQCQVVTINGVPTHEHGCPDSWQNPATGDPYEVECWVCGYDYTPPERPPASKYARVCAGCREEEVDAYRAELEAQPW